MEGYIRIRDGGSKMSKDNLKQGNKVGGRSKAINTFIENLKTQMHTNILVQVVKVDLANQRVDVRPVIYEKVRDENSSQTIINNLGEEVPVSDFQIPDITNVPIRVYRAGQFSITIPVAVGDTGTLIISERDISVWKDKGGFQPQGELRKFDLNDGIYDPFVPNATNKDTSYATDALEIKAGSDKIRMKGDGTILINGIDFMKHTHKGTSGFTVDTGTGKWSRGSTDVPQ